MSTLPFLLSVADELDNLNSQNYMDDFGLGFHPHRQYYRTPTIQLSLPAGTEWMEQEPGRHHSRYRSTYRYYGEPQNNLQSPAEGDEEDNECYDNQKHDNEADDAGSSTAQKYVSALNSNNEKDDIVDNSLQLYNISKKCSKDYYRHAESSTSSSGITTATALSTAAAASTSKPPPLPPRSSTAATASKTKDPKSNISYRLHSKCLEGNNSSSEESLQKATSSIEFLTCFLLKKTRVSKSPSAADGKKS